MRYLILLAALAIAACGSSSDDSSAAEAVEQGSDVLGEPLHESLEAAELDAHPETRSWEADESHPRALQASLQ